MKKFIALIAVLGMLAGLLVACGGGGGGSTAPGGTGANVKLSSSTNSN